MRDTLHDHLRSPIPSPTLHHPSSLSFTVLHRLRAFYEVTQSWILVLLSGLSIGLVAGWITVSGAWLIDMRLGYCSTEWYVSRAICCMGQIGFGGEYLECACARMLRASWLSRVGWSALITCGLRMTRCISCCAVHSSVWLEFVAVVRSLFN